MLCLFVWKLGISSHLFRFVWLSSKFWKRSSWNPELVQWARRKMGSVLISSAFKVIKRYYLNHSKELNFMRTMFPISVWAKNMRGTPKRIKFPPKSVMSPPLFRSHLHECSTDCRRTLCSRDVQSEKLLPWLHVFKDIREEGWLASELFFSASDWLSSASSLCFFFFLQLPFLHLPEQAFFSPLPRACSRFQELCFPGLAVGLHAAVSALHNVAVAFSSGHDPGGAQHPQPLIYVLTDLDTESIFSVRFNTVPSKMEWKMKVCLTVL